MMGQAAGVAGGKAGLGGRARRSNGSGQYKECRDRDCGGWAAIKKTALF